MTEAAALRPTSDDDPETRERRCIVTGEILPDNARIRFVVSPDGEVVPDIEGKLPGRGIWVKAERAVLAKAVAKNSFARAAKGPVTVAPDLPERVENLLVRRIVGDLGLARKSGALVFGFDNVQRALATDPPPAVLVEARDGSPEGLRKLKNAALAQGVRPKFVTALTSGELHLALGRENVIHAAVKPGRLAERLILEAARLEGFRPAEGRSIGPGSDKRNDPTKGME